MTKLLIEVPGMLIPIWISSTTVYLICGLQNDFAHWFLFETVFSFLGLSGLLIGVTAGVAIKHQNLAIQSAPLIVIPFVIYGGLVVNLNTLPAWSSWIQYISPLRYSFNVLVQSQLKSDALYHLGDHK